MKELDERIGMRPLDITFLSSLYLNDNPYFKEIQAVLKEYNRIVLVGTEQQKSEARLKPVLMDSLLKFMRLVMLTAERKAQQNLLEIVYGWYKERITKRDYQYKPRRQFQQMLERRLEQIREQEEKLKKIDSEKRLPSEMIELKKRLYIKRFRTEHTHVEPPEMRLKPLKRRVMEIEEVEGQSPKINKTENLLSRAKYLRPITEPAEPPIEQPLIPIGLLVQSIPLSVDNKDVSTARPMSTEVTMPLDTQLSLPLQEMTEMSDQEEQGKLDPVVKIYQYPPLLLNSTAEQRLQKRIYDKQQDLLRKNKEDAEQYQSVKEWSRNRSRMHSENNRKAETARHMAKVFSNKLIKINTDKNIHDFSLADHKSESALQIYQNTIRQRRAQSVKKFNQANINYQYQDPVNKIKGLSLLQRPERKVPQSNFARILRQHSKQRQRQHSLEQLRMIKQRFTTHRIPIKMNEIAGSLLLPEDLPAERLSKIGIHKEHLPSNPYMKVGKKKKVKKHK